MSTIAERLRDVYGQLPRQGSGQPIELPSEPFLRSTYSFLTDDEKKVMEHYKVNQTDPKAREAAENLMVEVARRRVALAIELLP